MSDRDGKLLDHTGVIFDDSTSEYIHYTVCIKVEKLPQLIEYLENVYNEHNANKASQ